MAGLAKFSPRIIVMLIYGYPPESAGGAERQCRLQAEELARQGHSVLVVAARQRWRTPRREQSAGLEICRCCTLEAWLDLWRKPGPTVSMHTSYSGQHLPKAKTGSIVRWLNACLFMANAGWILFLLRRRIAVLHVHGADWHAGFAGWIGHLLEFPVVCKGANLPVLPELTGIPFARVWEFWRKQIHYIALTEAMREDLAANDVSRDRIEILPNGVELPAEAADPGAGTLVLHVANYTQPAWNKAFASRFAAWPLVVRLLGLL